MQSSGSKSIDAKVVCTVQCTIHFAFSHFSFIQLQISDPWHCLSSSFFPFFPFSFSLFNGVIVGDGVCSFYIFIWCVLEGGAGPGSRRHNDQLGNGTHDGANATNTTNTRSFKFLQLKLSAAKKKKRKLVSLCTNTHICSGI